MKIKVQTEKNRTILYLYGDLDIQGSEVLAKFLKEILKDNSILEVLFDFKNARSVFSRGINVLKAFDKKFTEKGGKILLANLNKEVTEIFSSISLEKLFKIIDD